MIHLFQWIVTIFYLLLLILPLIYFVTGVRLLKIGLKERNIAKKKSAWITIIVSACIGLFLGVLWFKTMDLFAFSGENF